MTRLYRAYKWQQIATDLKPGQTVRLYDITDVRSLCNALRRAGERGSYTRDRHGFRVAKA